MASAYFKLKLIRKKQTSRLDKQLQSVETKKDKITDKVIQENKCRVCLNKGNIPIFGNERTPDYSKSLSFFGDIVVSSDDDYPKHLCKSCNSFLEGAIFLRKSAKESDRILRSKRQFLTETSDDLVTDDSEIITKQMNQTFHCKRCKLDFNSSYDLTVHTKSKQHRKLRIKCSKCSKLITANLFKRHLSHHQDANQLVCEVCGKLYRKDNLIRHMRLHTAEFPFQCHVCPYRGRCKTALSLHMRTHSNVKQFSCPHENCQAAFVFKSNLNKHVLIHQKEKPFRCKECPRSFYTQKELGCHIRSTHDGIKDFDCKICGSLFGAKRYLLSHELKVHKRKKTGRVPLYLQAEYNQNKL